MRITHVRYVVTQFAVIGAAAFMALPETEDRKHVHAEDFAALRQLTIPSGLAANTTAAVLPPTLADVTINETF
jgi:hypothetical protein